jgi:hypothetical protein
MAKRQVGRAGAWRGAADGREGRDFTTKPRAERDSPWFAAGRRAMLYCKSNDPVNHFNQLAVQRGALSG